MSRTIRMILLLAAAAAWLMHPATDRVIAWSAEPAAADSPRSSADSEATPAPSHSGDWPYFLGPTHDGVSTATGLLDEWPADGPPRVWHRKVGTGYSAPSILGERLVVHHRQGRMDLIECLHPFTGELLWKFDYRSDFSDPYGYNNGPRCSPLLAGDRCYTYGAQGTLLCLELSTGKKIWQRETSQDFEVPEHFFGAGCSPILEAGHLIVFVGGQPNAGVVAFDPETGETRWTNVGERVWNKAQVDPPGQPYRWTGTEMVVSYSPPIAATIHGQRHLFCLVRQGLVSLDPTNGQERFHYWFRSKTHESVNAARPVIIGDQVFLSAAYQAGAALLKILPSGKDYEVVWRKRDGLSTHWSTSIALDGHVFGFSGRHEQEAMFQCVDLATGDLKWETTGYLGPLDQLKQDPKTGEIRIAGQPGAVPWPFYGRGSKILADGKFIVLGERGTLALVRATSDEFIEISRCRIPELNYPSWTAPVLAHGRLYLRDEQDLLCFDLRQVKSTP